LISGLDQLGLDASNNHCLELLDIIADLMNVPKGNIEINWGKKYVSLMSESVKFDAKESVKSFRVYAEICYEELFKIVCGGGEFRCVRSKDDFVIVLVL
jgi:hypothetical protein